MADGVSQPDTEATAGEILRFAQDDIEGAQDDRGGAKDNMGADEGSQMGAEATAGEILRFAQDDREGAQDDREGAKDNRGGAQDDGRGAKDNMGADEGSQASPQDDMRADDGTLAGAGDAEAGDETISGLEVEIEDVAKRPRQAATSAGGSRSPSRVIWTPRFMVIFALTLSMGLSAESLLTQGWVSHYYAGQWVLMGHMAVIFSCFIAIMIVTRSWWLRVGCIFGCTWAVFSGINLVVSFYQLDPSSPIPAYLNAIISCALLGAYICLSTEHMPFTAWDSWFFRFLLIIGAGGVLLSYFIKPPIERSVSIIESSAAAAAIIFCVLVWWLRPSCWKTQPGPTFLFGVMPVMTLLLSIPSLGRGATNLYLSQVALLAVILGSMRILQGELKRR